MPESTVGLRVICTCTADANFLELLHHLNLSSVTHKTFQVTTGKPLFPEILSFLYDELSCRPYLTIASADVVINLS